MSQSPDEQLARELAREAAYLPERQQLWLFEQLRENFAATDSEQQRIDQLNKRMSEAVAVLERVAENLQLKDKKARLGLTMKDFDAVPESVREGWTARQVGDAVRGSWGQAKGIAFNNARLPVAAERRWEQREQLSRKRRESRFALNGLQEWLESEPGGKRRVDYRRWAIKQNKNLESGRKPLLSDKAIRRRWPFPWTEIVEAVEAGHLPGEDPDVEDELVDQTDEQEAGEDKSESEMAPAPSAPPELNLNRERLRSAREANNWTIKQLADIAGLDQSNLTKIESGEIRNPSFITVAKLAHVLSLPLNELITSSSKTCRT